MTLFESAYNDIAELVRKFEEHREQYVAHKYQEAELRADFLDAFWTALGWDVRHQQQTNPREQEVKIEKSDALSSRRADYAFYFKPNYKDPVFFCEAKKPSRDLANVDDYYQLVQYGYPAGTPLGVLTNFDEFHIIDCRYQPHIEKSYPSAQVKVFGFKDYLDREAFGYVYWLFSREAVEGGKLKEEAKLLPKQRGSGAAKLTAEEAKPFDEAFLIKLEEYRRTLAKAFKKADENLNADVLTEATQKVIDRLVFIRFLEDKYIETDYIVDQIAAKKGASWKSFLSWSKELDVKYNGVVFKPHDIDKQQWKAPDDKIFADLCADISHRKYRFTYIPIELLGSIYERFLGKVVTTTAKRADIEDKPEVRKAGGVYYTPKYIVDYIVANTVGRILDGDREPGSGNREESILTKNKLDGKNTDKKLSRSPSVTDGDGPDRRGIRPSGIAPEGREVRTTQPDESRSDLRSKQYSRAMGTDNKDLHLSSDGSVRITDGNRDTGFNSNAQEIPDSGTNGKILGVQLSDGSNAQSIDAVVGAGSGFRAPGTGVAPSPRTPEPSSRFPLTPKEISKLRFADIACGSGSFLIAVYDTVLHHVEKWYNDNPAEAKKAKCTEIEKGIFALSLKQKQQILLDNIYGVDIDRQAVEVAQLSLFLKLLESESGATAEQLSFERTKILPDLSKNIQCGNSLVEYDISDLFPLTTEEERKIKPFSFEQAFKQMAANDGFDAIVGNPPYLAGREWTESLWNLRPYFQRHYEAMTDQYDLYALFIQRAIELTRDGGKFGYITPTTWLNNEHYERLRTRMLETTTIDRIADLRNVRVFNEATVLPVVVIATHSSDAKKSTLTLIEVFETPDKSRTFETSADHWRLFPGSVFNLSVSHADVDILKKIEAGSLSLGTLADIKFGVKVYQKGKGRPKQTGIEADGKIFESTTRKDATYYPYLHGKDISSMFVKTNLTWLSWGMHLAEPRYFELFEGPRVLVRRIVGERLIVAPTHDTLIADQLLHTVKIKDNRLTENLTAAILHSKLMTYYFSRRYNRNEKTFPEIRVAELSSLPIRLTDDKKFQSRIEGTIDQMLATKKQIAQTQRDSEREELQRKYDYLESEIDRLVYELYGLTAEEIKIVEG